MLHMSVQGDHGCAKLCAGHMFSFPDSFLIGFAGDRQEAQTIKEVLPHGRIFIKMQRGWNADHLGFPGRCRRFPGKGLLPGAQYIKARGIVVNIFRKTHIPLAWSAVQKPFDAKQKFFQIKRFGKIIVHAEGEPFDLIRRIALGRKNQDRQPFIFKTDIAKDRQPVDGRQHDVQDDQIGLPRFPRLQLLHPAGGNVGRIALQIMEQLVGLGISWVWMGLEGKESQYVKLNGVDTHAPGQAAAVPRHSSAGFLHHRFAAPHPRKHQSHHRGCHLP